MDTEILKNVGKALYQTQYLKELKRYWVFRTRCRLHEAEMEGLLVFFKATPLRQELVQGTPSFVEQATRGFFYKGSRFPERISLIEQHVQSMEKLFTEALLRRLYVENKTVVLWEDTFNERPLQLALNFNGGQRKEGCLSLSLYWGTEELYQIMFWLAPDPEEPGQISFWLGALQGSPHGADTIKALTKAFFGYRTKNLIFFGLRTLAAALGARNIYAVTNAGYYAMNHIRRDRKLKTSLDEFWQECEGTPYLDERFYKMPVAEHRKDMSELKPSKRAQHRRRFEKLDALAATVQENLQPWLRKA